MLRLAARRFSTKIVPLYTAEASVIGARNGHVKSSDGVLDLKLVTPKELGGPGGRLTNPEQLFAGGYAACFGSALGVAAKQLKKKLPDESQITARVHIGKKGEGFGLGVDLTVKIPGVPKADAQVLADLAHKICPYSNAVKGNVDVTVSVSN